MIPYTFLAAAEAEFTAAALHYEGESPGVRARFVAAVRETVSLIQEFPELGSPLGRAERRMLVPGFPYQVVYRFDGQTIIVVAVAHLHRRPDYWIGRL